MRALLHIALVCLFLAGRAEGSDAFKNLPEGHWARALAGKVRTRGALDALAVSGPVTRYQFARALQAAVDKLPEGAAERLSAGEVADLSKLVKEFQEELTLIGAGPAPLQRKLADYRPRHDELREKVDRMLRPEKRHVKLAGGQLRLAGYSNDAGTSRGNLSLGAELRASPRVDGKVELQVTGRPDTREEDGLGVYQGYLDLKGLGPPFDHFRIGKFNYFLGAGQVLFDRVKGIDLTAGHGRNHYEAMLGQDQVVQMAFPGIYGGEVGYYYIKREAATAGHRPFHVGLFMRGGLGNRLKYGIEFSDYDNRVATSFNNNARTRGYLANVDYKMGRRFGVQAAAIVQQEDFRAFSIDHDMQFRGGPTSPLEDVLQALDSFSGGATASKNEINGLRDFKLGFWAKPIGDRTTLSAGWDGVGSHSTFFDTSRDAFSILSFGASRAMDADSELSVRARSLVFDFENPARMAGTLPIFRKDGTEVRAQYVRRF